MPASREGHRKGVFSARGSLEGRGAGWVGCPRGQELAAEWAWLELWSRNMKGKCHLSEGMLTSCRGTLLVSTESLAGSVCPRQCDRRWPQVTV